MCEEAETREPSPVAAKSDSENPQASGADAAKVQANLKARKRTKTGCLTCRKRRIKCGEERPVCANCIKSKRSCEGYAPRLTFKDPTYQPGWRMGFPYPTHPGPAGQYIRPPHPGTAVYPQFPAIAPRLPPGQMEYYMGPTQLPPNWQPGHSGPPQPAYFVVQGGNIPPQVQQQYQQFTSAPTTTVIQQSPTYAEAPPPVPVTSSPVQVSPVAQNISATGHPGVTSQWLQNTVAAELANNNQASASSPMTPIAAPHQPHVIIAQPHPEHPSPSWETSELFSPSHSYTPLDSAPTGSHPALVPFSAESTVGIYDHISVDPGHHVASGEIGSVPETQTQWQPAPSARSVHPQQPTRPALLSEPTQVSYGADEDDDYYDVMSDEEEATQDENVASHPSQKDVANILALATSHPDQDMRSYNSFIDDSNVLATYVPKYHNSPLMHPPTAKVFCHFVAATGPLLSAYGRHPVYPALFFSGTPAPKSHQALWTYTIPTLALSNPALLQSALALASLQISRLQRMPLTIPMKHYQMALRQVAKCVSIPSKRAAISTLAATMLLGHFEIISGEHDKWNSHLTGARQLLMEVDFKGMTKRIIDEKARIASSTNVDWSTSFVNAQFQSYGEELPWVPEPGSIDEGIVSQITGMKVKYDRYGSVVDESKADFKQPLSEKEMDDFQTHRDLFWFFTKLDMIQSLIRGRRLLLPFERWATCPPRGPIGRIDAVYGSLDHLHLLVGRIGDFAGKDLLRKRRAMKANGGIWRPPPGMFPGGPPKGPHGGPPPTSGSTASMPVAMPPTPGGMSSTSVGVPPTASGMPPTPTGMPPTPSGPPQTPSFPAFGASPATPTASARPPMPGGGPGPPTQPSFYGMMPDNGTSYDLPPSFASAPRDTIYIPPSPSDDSDVEIATATTQAETEWKSTQKSLTIFENSLGPSFAPLAADAGPVIATPFGLALQYRTYQIALCWILFYMGRIVAARTHPSMPPASMMASGVAAAQTAQWANTIGRIVFGMQTPSEDQPLNPVFGGALAETMLPLFVAGVQFMDPLQRTWTIERLQMIAERVGHDSAALIAAGLETVWVKQNEMGRGPRYETTVKVKDENGELLEFESLIRRKVKEKKKEKVVEVESYGTAFRKKMKTEGGASVGDDGDGAGGGDGKRGAVYLQPDTKDFAAGLMSLEEDFGEMGMGEGECMSKGNRF